MALECACTNSTLAIWSAQGFFVETEEYFLSPLLPFIDVEESFGASGINVALSQSLLRWNSNSASPDAAGKAGRILSSSERYLQIRHYLLI